MVFNALAQVHHRVGQVGRRLGMYYATALHRGQVADLGAGTQIAPWVVFWPPDAVHIGTHCLIQQGVRASAEHGLGGLVIGDHCQINRSVQLDMTGGLTIGSGTLISEGAVLYTHDHGLDPRSHPTCVPKTVGTHVWIGARAVLMPACQHVGDRAVIGAGAVVTQDVPAGAVVAGNPARIITRHVEAA